MKNILKLEELLFLGLAIFLVTRLDYAWWLYAVLFFTPDLSMIGYFVNPRIGSWSYNLIHHKGLAVTLYVLGSLIANPALQFTGALLLGHSSFDRVFGYGLKYPDSFQNTHLGIIGRSN